MEEYKADLGRLMAYVGLVAAELNMVALEAHQLRHWIEDDGPEQALCARERAYERVRWIERQCRNVLNGEGKVSAVEAPSPKT